MMSSLANAALFMALVATSAIVAVMYLKLKRLDAYHAEYKRIFDETGAALISAQQAVNNFSTEGKETLLALSRRIEEAKALVMQLDSISERAALKERMPSNVSNH